MNLAIYLVNWLSSLPETDAGFLTLLMSVESRGAVAVAVVVVAAVEEEPA